MSEVSYWMPGVRAGNEPPDVGNFVADRPAWFAKAPCAGDPVAFDAETRPFADIATAVCKRCAVFAECRAWADRIEKGTYHDGLSTVLAGETPRERYARRVQTGIIQTRRKDYQ